MDRLKNIWYVKIYCEEEKTTHSNILAYNSKG